VSHSPDVPLIIEFAPQTSLLREADRASHFRIVRNGPPGTFVVFPDGLRVSLPTDQIVVAEDTARGVRVGFGGMRFVGIEDGLLIFVRERELRPEQELSPDRSHRMTLDPAWVACVRADGRTVWSP
jgi:hypothetical protein